MADYFDKIDWQSVWDQAAAGVAGFVPNIAAAAAIFIALMLLYHGTRRPLHAVMARAGVDAVLAKLIVDNVYRFTLIVFGVIMAAGQLGINVTAALTGLGVVGLALGIAAQDTIANIISGFMIFLDRPFFVHDWVTVAGQYGEVSEITMRTTRLRTNNNTYVVIPNRKIIDEVLVNHSKHGETRLEVPIGIAYKESIPRAREVLLAAVGKVDGVSAQPASDVVVVECGSSSVDLLIRVWIANAREEAPVTARVIEAAKLALDAAGIEIPFPHMQLFVDELRDPVIEQAMRLRA